MRCDEVIRELAVPTDDRDGTALADHLAGCPSCVAWADRAARLDRLWNATRPLEPAPEAWGSVWANINQALESSALERERPATTPSSIRSGAAPKLFTHPGLAPSQPSSRPRTRRFMAIAMMVGVAQAAAILIAVGLAWHDRHPDRAPRAPRLALENAPAPAHGPSVIRAREAVVFEVDIEEGRLIKFCVDGPMPRVEDVTPQQIFGIRDQPPSDMMMFNVVESFARTVVASQ